ncbi:hypothetical protein JCM6294_3654 [Bacteroides pyogenes DSM 20611 = JCM 6294]|uniref:Uncharacterized protein n=1 Tax=Bacteroides pyogenes DSM 20611 = JCM 6294 TaxID=1121100 RepID=W4PMX8_9BACE|nr:hypothetical protein JCM6294_3654 [Bacteroides pyogenes DSM 20611 = JCM 6294]
MFTKRDGRSLLQGLGKSAAWFHPVLNSHPCWDKDVGSHKVADGLFHGKREA